jgi:hypothetical protein
MHFVAPGSGTKERQHAIENARAGRRGVAERGDLAGVEAVGKIGAIGRGVGGVSVGWDVRRGVAAGEQACQEASKTKGG